MAKNYKVIPPQQEFMELRKIYAAFGSKPVVAYGCNVVNNTPMGGHVIAVMNKPEGSTEGIKAYMKQLKERFPEKEPVYYICIREDGIIYDSGQGEKKTLPEIMEKGPSEVQQHLESFPAEMIAKALSTALFEDKDKSVKEK